MRMDSTLWSLTSVMFRGNTPTSESRLMAKVAANVSRVLESMMYSITRLLVNVIKDCGFFIKHRSTIFASLKQEAGSSRRIELPEAV